MNRNISISIFEQNPTSLQKKYGKIRIFCSEKLYARQIENITEKAKIVSFFLYFFATHTIFPGKCPDIQSAIAIVIYAETI